MITIGPSGLGIYEGMNYSGQKGISDCSPLYSIAQLNRCQLFHMRKLYPQWGTMPSRKCTLPWRRNGLVHGAWTTRTQDTWAQFPVVPQAPVWPRAVHLICLCLSSQSSSYVLCPFFSPFICLFRLRPIQDKDWLSPYIKCPTQWCPELDVGL